MWCLTDLWILFYSYILWNKNVEFVQELFYDILITGSLRMTVKEIVIFNWKQGAFFYWLTVGKTSAKNTQNTTCALGSVGLGGWNYFSEAFLLKKTTRKPFAYYLAPMEVIPCLTYSGNMETKKARAIRFIIICIWVLEQKTLWSII